MRCRKHGDWKGYFKRFISRNDPKFFLGLVARMQRSGIREKQLGIICVPRIAFHSIQATLLIIFSFEQISSAADYTVYEQSTVQVIYFMLYCAGLVAFHFVLTGFARQVQRL